jgi:hypothetical protein
MAFLEGLPPVVRRLLTCSGTPRDKANWTSNPTLRKVVAAAYGRFLRIAVKDEGDWPDFVRFHSGPWLEHLRERAKTLTKRRGRPPGDIQNLRVVIEARRLHEIERRLAPGVKWVRERRSSGHEVLFDDEAKRQFKHLGYNQAEIDAVRRRRTARAAAIDYLSDGTPGSRASVKAMAAEGRKRLGETGEFLD